MSEPYVVVGTVAASVTGKPVVIKSAWLFGDTPKSRPRNGLLAVFNFPFGWDLLDD